MAKSVGSGKLLKRISLIINEINFGDIWQKTVGHCKMAAHETQVSETRSPHDRLPYRHRIPGNAAVAESRLTVKPPWKFNSTGCGTLAPEKGGDPPKVGRIPQPVLLNGKTIASTEVGIAVFREIFKRITLMHDNIYHNGSNSRDSVPVWKGPASERASGGPMRQMSMMTVHHNGSVSRDSVPLR